jgi:trans-2-enoyl-CoA reductase
MKQSLNKQFLRMQKIAGVINKSQLNEGFSPEAIKKQILTIKDKPEEIKKLIQNVAGGIVRGTNWTALEDLRNILNIIKEEGIEIK